MTDPNAPASPAPASPERIQQMKNYEAQAEAAKHWMTQKKLEENREIEQETHDEELASIENEINNL